MADIDSPLNLVVRRLRHQTHLSEEDVGKLYALPGEYRVLEAGSFIVREGEPPRHCAFLLSGFAFRQKLTNSGARQIVGLQIPGDALDLQSLYLDVADHNVQALTRAEILLVPRSAIQRLAEASPGIAHAIIVNILTEASITREWLLNVGRRDARTRLAHLLCEFATRMDAQGLAGEGGYELPMTQEQLGDALGLTSVHINRTLKVLEGEGALVRQGRRIRFTDWKNMRRIADFSDIYLHIGDQTG